MSQRRGGVEDGEAGSGSIGWRQTGDWGPAAWRQQAAGVGSVVGSSGIEAAAA